MSLANARQTIRNTSVFSFFTVISRFLGLARDMLKAYAFGTGVLAVAFDVAFRIPNMLRNMVAEGALSQSFIPLYENYRNEDNPDKSREREAAGAVLAFLALVIGLASVLAFFLIPYILPPLLNDPNSAEHVTRLTVNLARILFPYIVLMSLASVYMAIQYSYNVFWAASMGPALLNIVILVFFGFYLFFFHPREALEQEQSVYVFSVITLLAAIVQLVFQERTVAKMGLAPRYRLNLSHPIIKSLFVMMLPAVFGAAVQEIGQLIDIFLATALRSQVPGAVAALTYSHRLIQLPIGVFGVAVATASLPQLSRLFREKRYEEYQDSLFTSININLFLLLPASLGLLILAHPIVALLFERGEFDAASTEITAHAMRYYAPGIIAYSLQKLFMSSLYARQNSRVPALITALVLVVNVLLSLLFMPWLLHGGLALGSSLAGFAGVSLYLWQLKKMNLLHMSPEKKSSLLKIVFLNLLFALALATGYFFLQKSALWLQLLLIPLAILLYFSLAQLLALPEWELFREILQRLKGKLLGNKSSPP